VSERLDRIETNLEVLSERVGQLAQEVSDLRQATSELKESISGLSQEQRLTANELRQELRTSLEDVNQARREDIQVMVNIVDTLSASIRDLRETQLQMFHTTNADRTAWQSEIQRIWEYLLSTRPNGRGEQGGSG
jgi:predicted nuclease with TOPRIM domain